MTDKPPFDPKKIRLHDPSTWEPLTPTSKQGEVDATRVTWEDVRRQAVHCPFLTAMLEMQRRQVWETPEEALLWVTLMLSESRIRALNEHAQTLMRIKP